MLRWNGWGLLVAALALAPAPLAAETESPSPLEAALARVRALEQQVVNTVDAVTQSSVTVFNKQIPKEQPGRPFSRVPRLAGGGSGVIIARGGRLFILTNQHVVDNADVLTVVTRDGEERAAELVDAVPQYDIAMLRFTGKTQGIKGVPVVGSKSAQLEEGQWCVATGNPFFLAADGRPVATLGVVSGLDRVLSGSLTYGRAIQHDAPVNPGNSGGPVWNMKGEFVGINGMIQSLRHVEGQAPSNQGAAYAIPVQEVDAFLGALIDSKKDAAAGYLGIGTETDTDRNGKPIGARVRYLEPRSPAALGSKRLEVDDVIVSLTPAGRSTTKILTGSDLANALSLLPAGTKVSIGYRRREKKLVWSGELGRQ